MTREEHDRIFIEFSENFVKHSPGQDYLDAQWALAVGTGICKETPETLERMLHHDLYGNTGVRRN